MPKPEKDSTGRFPHSAWPGLYPLYYLTEDGGILCAPCANQENGSIASIDNEDPQWCIIAVEAHMEGEPLECAHCSAKIESAYGVPEDDDNA